MNKNNTIISGYNVYQDNNGRNVIYNKRNHTGYLIQQKDEQKFLFYKNRALYVFIGVILAINFSINPLICFGIGVLTLAFLEYQYRFKFLSTLSQLSNFKPYKKTSFVENISKNYTSGRIITFTLLYGVLGVLIILNAFEMKLQSLSLFLNLLLAAGAFVLSACHILGFIKQKK